MPGDASETASELSWPDFVCCKRRSLENGVKYGVGAVWLS